MRRLTRTAVSLGLSLAMAFGCVPTQALAEAVEEVTAEQGEETGAPIELEASEDETSEDKALDKDEDLPAEEDLVEVDDPAADVPVVVEDETDGDPDEQEDDIILTTQSEIVASGTWGTCPWEITSDGVLTIRPGTGGPIRVVVGEGLQRRVDPLRGGGRAEGHRPAGAERPL